MLIVPDSGELRLLQYIVNINRSNTDHLVLHIYTNDVDPDDGSFGASGEDFSLGTFTEAAASVGYGAITLTGSNWTTIQSSGVSTARYNTGVTFNFTAGTTVVGCYVTNTANELLWAERFDGAPFDLPEDGADIAVRPQITCS